MMLADVRGSAQDVEGVVVLGAAAADVHIVQVFVFVLCVGAQCRCIPFRYLCRCWVALSSAKDLQDGARVVQGLRGCVRGCVSA